MYRESKLPWLALAIGAVLFTSCQGIPRAPEGSPRIEVELEVNLGDSFGHVLEYDEGELEALATEAVSSYADMGLRLYPVPSDAYEQYEDRPEYSLRLDLDGFHVLVSEKLVENPASQTKSIRKQLDRVVCRSKAVFTKRRAGRPPLRVGAGVGHASTNATTPSTVLESAIPVRASIDDGYGLTVNSTNVTSVIKDATLEALSNLTPAMDREISLL